MRTFLVAILPFCCFKRQYSTGCDGPEVHSRELTSDRIDACPTD